MSELVRLKAVLNTIPGIHAHLSTDGEGERTASVWFHTEDWQALAWVGYFARACHSGVNWSVRANPDCAATPNSFVLESVNPYTGPIIGEQALKDAERIANAIESYDLTDTTVGEGD